MSNPYCAVPALSIKNPLSVFKSAWINRLLIARLTRREIEGRYRGSFLGLAWSLIVPLLLLCVYTFVFSVIFKARWDTPVEGGKAQFALILFCGLILFNVFSECINRAPMLVLSNVVYIKKVVFPLEILPWVALLCALFNAVVSIAVLAVGYFIFIGVPPLTVFLLPLLMLPLIVLVIGLSLFLSSVGVFVRDLQQLIGLVTMIMMFLSPLFYPVSAVPERFRQIIELNPMTIIIEGARGIVFWGRFPDLLSWAVLSAAAWVSAWLGYAWFMKTRKGFADVV